ncbi:hypothetical protein L1987_04430 [Smallanthus sonchifolius]|uniref:Uncharacterized protein n=1 Tax=Smallanthus sonchifolius TaxID=185202 RepID=A0ACB9KDE9_9ASTR|nr:hypothetical protein L1987_04430 [Smallanthus sonchifolius]
MNHGGQCSNPSPSFKFNPLSPIKSIVFPLKKLQFVPLFITVLQMDPRFDTSMNQDGKALNNRSSFQKTFSLYDPVNDFRGIQIDPPTTSSSPVVSSNELHEDCDLSDAILGYISQVLMEEDMEDKPCMLYESLDLQAAEKSFYEVLGQKYPPSPSPSYDEGLFSVDHFIQSPNDSSSLDHNTYADESPSGNDYSQNDSNLHGFGDHNVSWMSQTSSNRSNNVVDFLDSPENTFLTSEICDKDHMMMKFNKGIEEANKFLPNLLTDFNGGVPTVSRVRKSAHGEDEDDQRSSKQAAIFQDSTLRSNEIDLILLCSMGQGDVALRLLRNTLRTETSKDKHQDCLPKSLTKGKGKTRGKKPKNKKEVIDLRTLLVTCAQAVAVDDRRNATNLLKQIRQHASPFGDGNQRTIMDMAEKATRIHIIDFGILYGFQWPTFIQRISQREGGPPRLRLTGIEFPQPGFKPAETIEETGARLKEYAKQFNVPFEYNPIAKRWENVNIEDLKIDENEFVVVNCMYRSKNLLDETVGVDSARNVVLDLIKKISPNIFIHGILNGSYNAPFFLTRFKEALFHFSALFDMLETNVPRERSERMMLEGEVFGREALNVIACEGWERIERPETYKQWHVRNLRAGLVSVPFSRWIINLAEEKVGLYHKDFMIDVDNYWLLQGWKGRIIYAISCWKPA